MSLVCVSALHKKYIQDDEKTRFILNELDGVNRTTDAAIIEVSNQLSSLCQCIINMKIQEHSDFLDEESWREYSDDLLGELQDEEILFQYTCFEGRDLLLSVFKKSKENS